MQVQVLYFGMLKEMVGLEGSAVELKAGASTGDLLALLRRQHAPGSGLWDALALAVNRQYAGRDQRLSEGDEVALLPPVSGGCR